MNNYVAVKLDTEAPVKPGDTLIGLRGEKYTFLKATRPNSPGRDGKILVGGGREYYARVFGCKVVGAK